jgi:hypothetical protein
VHRREPGQQPFLALGLDERLHLLPALGRQQVGEALPVSGTKASR